MTCINGIPTEVKARRIIQCPGDTPLNVAVTNQRAEFDHTILCEANEDGEQTGVKVLAVIAYTEAGVPSTTYYNVADGEIYSLPEGYQLTACAEAIGASVRMQPMCDDGTTFIRWFILAGGEPTGVYHDTTFEGTPYVVEDVVKIGACEDIVYELAGGVEVTGTSPLTGGTEIPIRPFSITITSKTGSVSVNTDGINTIVIPEGGSFSWGEGNENKMMLSESFTVTGDSAESNYIVHWEE